MIPCLSPQLTFARAFDMGAALRIREEDGPNKDRSVLAIQQAGGGKEGDSWCADTVAFVGSKMFRELWPLMRTGSCDELWASAKKKNLVRERPAVGAIFLAIRNGNDAHHTGVVLEVFSDGSWKTSEGNASDPKEAPSSNGDGWYSGRIRGTHADTTKYAFVYWWEAIT